MHGVPRHMSLCVCVLYPLLVGRNLQLLMAAFEVCIQSMCVHRYLCVCAQIANCVYRGMGQHCHLSQPLASLPNLPLKKETHAALSCQDLVTSPPPI